MKSKTVHLPVSVKHSALALSVLWLSGCSFIPAYERPTDQTPAQWPDAMTQAVATHSVAPLEWKDFVQDGNLQQLVGLALQNNQDLQAAILSIERARAQHQVQSSARWPTAGVGATAEVRSAEGGSNTELYTAGLALSSWEIDFFGRIASLSEAALAQYFSTQEAQRAVQTAVVASVASTWMSYQANTEILRLAQQALATREDSLKLNRRRFEVGVASAVQLRQAESLTAAARASVALQQRLLAQDRNALALLLGQSVPEALLQPAIQGQSPLRDIPVGLPSDLLTYRPDIRQAEQQLIAANAQIGAARAAFFPNISLTASAGSASTSLSGLFSGGSWGVTLAPQLFLPIFSAGRLQANLDVAQVDREMALVQYQKAIQTAFKEVSDGLAGQATLGQQLQATREQSTAEAERLRLADLRYRSGVDTYLDVLDAQRSLFATQQAVAQLEWARWQNQIQLYKAMGGGWNAKEIIDVSKTSPSLPSRVAAPAS